MHFTVGDFCVGDSCVCPDDTERAGEQIQKVQKPLWLAVPGGNTGTSVKTDVISLADWCEHWRPDRPVVPDPLPNRPV